MLFSLKMPAFSPPTKNSYLKLKLAGFNCKREKTSRLFWKRFFFFAHTKLSQRKTNYIYYIYIYIYIYIYKKCMTPKKKTKQTYIYIFFLRHTLFVMFQNFTSVAYRFLKLCLIDLKFHLVTLKLS